MTTSKSTTTTNQVSGPGFTPQSKSLNIAFPAADRALETAQQATPPTDFVSQMTPDQLAVFSQMLGTGGSNLATSNGLVDTGAQGASSALSGLVGFDPAASNNMGANIAGGMAYAAGADIPAAVRNAMLTATQQARDVTLPGITSGSAVTGNINSNRPGLAAGMVERGLGQQAADLGSTMYDQLFGQGASLTQGTNTANNSASLAALTGALGGGNALYSSGQSGITSGLNQMTTGAAGPQQQQQLALDNALQQFQAGTSFPYSALQNYYNIIGANNWGTTQSGSSTTNSTPSAMQTVGALLGAGGSLLGSRSGAFGGGSGLLGASGSLFGLLH